MARNSRARQENDKMLPWNSLEEVKRASETHCKGYVVMVGSW